MKISRRFDEGKSNKQLFKKLRYGPQKTVSKHLKRFTEIQWNCEICLRCLVLLEMISFDSIFETATQKFAIRYK